MKTSLEDELAAILSEQIQKEIDADIIWQAVEQYKWPCEIPFLHYNAVKSWLDKYYTNGEDYVYRSGRLYFKEQKVYTWFILRWSGSIPHNRKA